MVKSMTEGKSIKLILQFAFPLLLGNLVQQTYNMADAAIVGKKLGTNALAAVGASTSVQFLVLGFVIGTCAGFGIPIAQAFGAGDYSRMRKYIFHSALWTGIIGLLLTSITALLTGNILHLMQTPEDIYRDAYLYLLVIFLGIPFSLLYNLTSSMLRAVGDSKTPFVILAISAFLNIFLDLFCIVVLKWGCFGAAIATISSQAISGVLCLILILKRYEILRPKKEEMVFVPSIFGYVIKMGAPMGFQYSVTAIGSMVMQSANNALGSVYVSAFTAATRIKQFTMCPFDALATGVGTFVGQNFGAGKMQRVKMGIIHGAIVGVIYGAFIGLIMIVFGRMASLLFMDGSKAVVLDASAEYLRAMGFFYWVLGVLNVCRYSVQGLGYSGRAIFSGLVEMLARTIVSLIFVPMFAFSAICFADQTAWVSATLYNIPVCIWAFHKCVSLVNGNKEKGINRLN